jgi:hypothetical protein
MTIEEQLKEIILSQYKSVRQFAIAIDVPQSTMATVFSHGILNSNIKVIIKAFGALGLDLESISTGELKKAPLQSGESRLKEEPVKKAQLETMLLALKIIKPGEDISDEDLRFLSVWLDGLASWFKHKREGGDQ